MNLTTPYYLIHEDKLLKNLKIVEYIRKQSGAKVLLALKCFSTWSVFNLIKKYLDGTTSSSLYEARLGYEKFGKEVHAYSVAYSEAEIKKVKKYANKVIFNSLSQLNNLYKYVKSQDLGLRINPRISYSHFDLANPARKYSRLGVINKEEIKRLKSKINGVMFHFNCENGNFKNFSANLNRIAKDFGDLLKDLNWISLGGGINFTAKDYPLAKFCQKLQEFSRKFKINIYLEPGEAIITQTTELVTRVLDIVHNDLDIAIVDSSTEAHMLDLLIYQTNPKIKESGKGEFRYMVAGRSCLAGDVFGIYQFKNRLKIGKIIRINDAGGYTMVKKNWFNGLKMPSIAIKRLDGSVRLVRNFYYKNFVSSLS